MSINKMDKGSNNEIQCQKFGPVIKVVGITNDARGPSVNIEKGRIVKEQMPSDLMIDTIIKYERGN